jgi:hypothetical protein
VCGYPGAFQSQCITSEKQNKKIFTLVTAFELEALAIRWSGKSLQSTWLPIIQEYSIYK